MKKIIQSPKAITTNNEFLALNCNHEANRLPIDLLQGFKVVYPEGFNLEIFLQKCNILGKIDDSGFVYTKISFFGKKFRVYEISEETMSAFYSALANYSISRNDLIGLVNGTKRAYIFEEREI